MSQRLAEQSSQVLKSNADIQVELKELRDQIESLQASLETTSQRLEVLTNEMAAARDRTSLTPAEPVGGAPGETQAPVGTTATRPSEPAQLYSSAYEDYLRGNFDLAIQGFREYASRYPTTDLADNALYWIGETYFAAGDYHEAIRYYSRVADEYGDQNKAPDAMFKIGMSYERLGDLSLARRAYENLIRRFPYATPADSAKNALQRIKY
jgi:tol-pal system protein YbgF